MLLTWQTAESPLALLQTMSWVRWPLYMLVELQVFKSPAKEELYLGSRNPIERGKLL